MSAETPPLQELVIRPFRPCDQAAVRHLIFDGLRERWGELDETKNSDLDDIADCYANGFFLVACLRDEVIGTGALIPEAAGVGRIVRMSVARTLRRQGVGRKILAAPRTGASGRLSAGRPGDDGYLGRRHCLLSPAWLPDRRRA